MEKAYVEVRVYRGDRGREASIRFELGEPREIFEPIETSDDPFAILMESLPLRASYRKVRKERLEFRGAVARNVMRLAEAALMEIFAEHDRENGYPLATSPTQQP